MEDNLISNNPMLRFALAVGETSSMQFKAVLLRLVCHVLFLNDSKAMSLGEIVSETKSVTGLSFSRSEIEESISNSKGNVLSSPKSGSGPILYRLSPDGIAKEKRSSFAETKLEETIHRFYEANVNDLPKTEDEVKTKNIIISFLYSLFDLSKDQLLGFLDKAYCHSAVFPKSTPVNQGVILEFLNWADSEKDHLVFSLCNAAISYCTLTLKETINLSAFLDKKKFYLDTNVIFSLIGINGDENKQSMEIFLSKCKENNISLFFTNLTEDECRKTIVSFALSLQRVFAGNEPFDSELTSTYFEDTQNSQIFEVYSKWAASNETTTTDYSAFCRHLLESLNETLKMAKKEIIPISLNPNENDAETLQISLAKRKAASGRQASPSSVSCDVQNYLYIRSQYPTSANSFDDITAFFLTYDRHLCYWVQYDVLPGCISPFATIDSVYSIILRLSKRSEDDYRSFSTFVSTFVLGDSPEFDITEEKEKLFSSIAQIQEKPKARNEILKSANEIYREEKLAGVPFDAEKIINQAYEKIVPLFENEAKNEQKKSDQKEIDSIKTQAAKDVTLAMEKGKKAANDITRELLVDKEICLRKKKKRIVYIVFLSVLFVSCIFYAISYFVQNDFFKIVKDFLAFITGGFSLFAALIFSLITKLTKESLRFSTEESIVRKYISNEYKIL